MAYVSPFWSIACSFDDSKVKTQTRPVLSGCEMTGFCYITRSIIHNVHSYWKLTLSHKVSTNHRFRIPQGNTALDFVIVLYMLVKRQDLNFFLKC